MSKYYITTPIYYVNANPHIGHAYTQVVCDVMARYHRMLGDDVFFLTGTDEHGEKIEEASLAAGYSKGEEKKFVDGIVDKFKSVWTKLNIKHDHFIRTTDPEHNKYVQDLLQRLYDDKKIIEGEYDGWYCTPCETFWTDTQAEEGVCPECKRPVEKLKEKNYFFKMSDYQKDLIDHINGNEYFVQPDFRKNEVMGFLREELTDLCISRPRSRMSWGIELPFDKDYVVYVWFDALVNYLSGIVASGRDPEKFWPADVHVIAKDILRHHAVYWPTMLMGSGIKLPETVFAHGWWKMGEAKISKSRGNAVDPVELCDKYGVDAVRFFLLKAVKLGLDGVFSEDALVTIYNSDLANDLGNLLNRTLTMVEKYFDGVAPVMPDGVDPDQKKRSDALIGNVRGLLPRMKEDLSDKNNAPKLLLKEELDNIFSSVIGPANKYIEESAPWGYAKKGDIETIKLIMLDLLEALRKAAIALAPFMPEKMQEMWGQLGLEGNLQGFDIVSEIENPEGKERFFASGTRVKKGEPLFNRIK